MLSHHRVAFNRLHRWHKRWARGALCTCESGGCHPPGPRALGVVLSLSKEKHKKGDTNTLTRSQRRRVSKVRITQCPELYTWTPSGLFASQTMLQPNHWGCSVHLLRCVSMFHSWFLKHLSLTSWGSVLAEPGIRAPWPLPPLSPCTFPLHIFDWTAGKSAFKTGHCFQPQLLMCTQIAVVLMQWGGWWRPKQRGGYRKLSKDCWPLGKVCCACCG